MQIKKEMITKEMAVSMHNEIISSVCRKIRHDISGKFNYRLRTEKFQKTNNEYRDFIILSISYNGTFLSTFNIPTDVDMAKYNSWRLPEELIHVLIRRNFIHMKCELIKK